MISAVATWCVSGGEYIQEESGQLIYQSVQSSPQTWQVMTALYTGFTKQAGIIIFILIIGGAFWIVNSTKAIDMGIFSFLESLRKMEKYSWLRRLGVNNLVLVLIMLLFSLFGGVFGMSEETIAFVVILVPLAISMGYDSIVGVCLVYVAAHVGFAGAFLNPFTIGVAQDMAGLPLFSGIEYRLLCWLVLNVLMITFVLIYASRVKKNPSSSVMYEADAYWRDKVNDKSERPKKYSNTSSWVTLAVLTVVLSIFTFNYYDSCFIQIGQSESSAPWLLILATALFVICSVFSLMKSVHYYILNLLAFTIVYLVIGVLAFHWYIPEISALFLTLGLASGIASGLSPNNIVKEFMFGAKDILSAAVIVGLAAGIIVILQDGKIIDTILHSMAVGLEGAGKTTSLSLMYGIQTLINMVIPSATAKAAITIPIMAPFADLIGLSRQATVLAFQFGDGFTNMITPTSGVLLAALGLARIPYTKWVKWVWKFIVALLIMGFLLLLPTIFLNLPGF